MPTSVGDDLRFLEAATDNRADGLISWMPTWQATDYCLGTRAMGRILWSRQAFRTLWLELGLFTTRDSLNVLSKPEDHEHRHHDCEQQELARQSEHRDRRRQYDRGTHRGYRHGSAEREDYAKCRERKQNHQRRNREPYAQPCRHSFAAAKAQKHRPDRSEKRGEARPCDRRMGEAHRARDDNWNRALQHVAGKRDRGRTHTAGARDVGGPDISRADRARIEAAHPADDHASRNR